MVALQLATRASVKCDDRIGAKRRRDGTQLPPPAGDVFVPGASPLISFYRIILVIYTRYLAHNISYWYMSGDGQA